MLEVHSRQYKSTVCKTISNVIDMFRLLHLYNEDIDRVRGFVFPKAGKDHVVTKVTVQFDPVKFVFEVGLDFIAIGNVKDEIYTALRAARGFKIKCRQSMPHFFKLSAFEIQAIQETWKLTEGSMYQVPTSHNMLFCVGAGGHHVFYKYIVDQNERIIVGWSSQRLNRCDHAVTHHATDVLGVLRPVFMLLCLIHPLSFAEVQRCLYNFVKLTGDAINAIHLPTWT